MRPRRLESSVSLSTVLTPMIDMFTTLIIFLIVNFSPEEAQIRKSSQIELPASSQRLTQIPSIQVEVSESYVRVNGVDLVGLVPESDQPEWAKLKSHMNQISPEPQSIMLLADKKTSYVHIDRAMSHLAAAGFGSIFLLTSKEDKAQGGLQ